MIETTSDSDNFVVDVDSANPNGYKFLNSLDLDQDVIRRLSQHLHALKQGNSSIYVTPLGKENSPDAILSMVDKLINDGSSKLNDTLLELEQSNRSKFGPRSIAKPWSERLDGVREYFELPKCSIPPPLLYSGVPRSVGSLRPLNLENAISYVKTNTNSGLPFFTRKGKVLDRYSRSYDSLLMREDPCILFTRTQENNKTRDVFGYPTADTINEMRFYRPVLDYQRKLPWRSSLLGPASVDRRVTNIINTCNANSDYSLLSIDFSSFDKTIGSALQNACFKYIKSLFQNQYHADIDYIADRFMNIGLVTPSGVMNGSHGVPSGSTFTNEVDSIAQFLIANSLGYMNSDNFDIQGDDGVYGLKFSHIDSVVENFKKAGLEPNESKSYVNDKFCIYLQKLYHVDYRNDVGIIGGIYPIYRAINRIVYQERWSDFEDYDLSGKDYYSIRAISILENCKYHPLFKEFVSLVVKLDKYKLSVTDKGIANYVKMISEGPGVGGSIYNQYGDDVRGIKSFETYKIIKDLL